MKKSLFDTSYLNKFGTHIFNIDKEIQKKNMAKVSVYCNINEYYDYNKKLNKLLEV